MPCGRVASWRATLTAARTVAVSTAFTLIVRPCAVSASSAGSSTRHARRHGNLAGKAGASRRVRPPDWTKSSPSRTCAKSQRMSELRRADTAPTYSRANSSGLARSAPAPHLPHHPIHTSTVRTTPSAPAPSAPSHPHQHRPNYPVRTSTVRTIPSTPAPSDVENDDDPSRTRRSPPRMESSSGWAVTACAVSLRCGRTAARRDLSVAVGREGFEPSKATPADLQSAPFGRSGTDPGVPIARLCGPHRPSRTAGRAR